MERFEKLDKEAVRDRIAVFRSEPVTPLEGLEKGGILQRRLFNYRICNSKSNKMLPLMFKFRYELLNFLSFSIYS